DPEGIEGPPGACAGLGLLQVETVLGGDKTLTAVDGVSVADGVAFAGYEMHVGRSGGPDAARPLVRFADGVPDGATSPDGRIAGCYVHGFFAHDAQRAAWVTRLGGTTSDLRYEQTVEATLDALADHLARHVDLDQLLAIAGETVAA
ncbi:MAG: cobyric acid synthase CobQ, partial [Caulobacteraceae bacterium]|nr:cobyric acid synthase CobQ [Caulobacter sp.]